MQKTTVGIVGLGAMGSSMAKHVLAGGFTLYGFDRSPERVDALLKMGMKTGPSLASVAPEIDALIIMVVEAEQTDEILFAGENAAAKMKKGSVVVSTSTIPPLYVKDLEGRLAGMGLGLLDSPVSGGHLGAQNGSLTLMLSGKKEFLAKVQSVLDCFSKKIYYVGEECGMGSTLKVVHQHLASSHIALTVEALGLCKKAGLDPQYFLDVVKNSAGTSKIFESFAPLLIAKDYTPHSSVNVTEKDLRLVVELARALDYKAPVVEEAYRMFLTAKEKGLGNLSPVAAIKLLNVDWE